LSYASRLDSLSGQLLARNLDSLALDYPQFVKDTYGSAAAVRGYVGTTKEYAATAKLQEEIRLNKLAESMRWIVSGQDSIPLFIGEVASKYKPLIISDERFTAGIHYADSLSPLGYLYSINAARVPEVKVMFPVEKSCFREARLGSSKALSFTDAAGHLYYVLIYSVRPDQDNKIDATLAKIYKTDGLAWSMDYKLAFIPTELQFATLTGELTIVGENGQRSTMDKGGKIKN
jgi:hypothetical protein